MKNININGIKYKVEEIETEVNNMGRTQQKPALISICETMNRDVKYNTLFHEIFHIFYRNCGLTKNTDEEHVVEAMSNQMFAFIKSNKPMILEMLNIKEGK